MLNPLRWFIIAWSVAWIALDATEASLSNSASGNGVSRFNNDLTSDSHESPLLVLHYDSDSIHRNWMTLGNLEHRILSRGLPVRNYVIVLESLALNPSECRLVSTNPEADFFHRDPFLLSDYEGAVNSGILGTAAFLKAKYPYIKIVASIGGWSYSHAFEDCFKENKTTAMIASIVQVVTAYGLDGIDINWQHPGCSEAKPCGCKAGSKSCPNTPNKSGSNDWEMIQPFLWTLKDELNKAWVNRGQINTPYIVSLTLGTQPAQILGSNDQWEAPIPFDVLCAEDSPVDLIDLMFFDYFGPWSAWTGPHAPLYSDSSVDLSRGYSINDSLQAILAKCAAPHKLVFGLAAFGRAWQDIPKDGGAGNIYGLWTHSRAERQYAADGTWETGKVAYWDIDENFLGNETCFHTWDSVSRTPFLFCDRAPPFASAINRTRSGGAIFISYEDQRSWAEKMQLARRAGLSGASIYRMSDFAPPLGQDGRMSTLLTGLFEGWKFNTPFTLGGIGFNGEFAFIPEKTSWPNYPCPLPAGTTIDDGKQQPNECPVEAPASAMVKAQGTGAEDLVGKDVPLVVPLDKSSIDKMIARWCSELFLAMKPYNPDAAPEKVEYVAEKCSRMCSSESVVNGPCYDSTSSDVLVDCVLRQDQDCIDLKDGALTGTGEGLPTFAPTPSTEKPSTEPATSTHSETMATPLPETPENTLALSGPLSEQCKQSISNFDGAFISYCQQMCDYLYTTNCSTAATIIDLQTCVTALTDKACFFSMYPPKPDPRPLCKAKISTTSVYQSYCEDWCDYYGNPVPFNEKCGSGIPTLEDILRCVKRDATQCGLP